MKQKFKTMGRICLIVLYAILLAYMYYWMTFTYMYDMIVEGLILEAYMYNLFAIVFVLLIEKFTCKLIYLRRYMRRSRFLRFLRACLLPKYGIISFKTGLYLYYVFMMFYSLILQHSPDIEVSTTFQYYVVAMDYGIFMLLSVDLLFKQIKFDNAKICEIIEMEKDKAQP